MRTTHLLSVATIATLLACSSQNGGLSAAPDSARPPSRASTTTGALSAEMVQPYFPGAAEKFRNRDRVGAKKAFQGLRKKAKGTDRARLTLLVAECDASQNRFADAAKGFATAAKRLPLLADYAHYQAARSHYFAHQHDASLKHARQVSADSSSGADAELLVGDILRGRKKHAATAAHYRGYIERRPKGIRLEEARFRLAEALENDAKTDEALTIFRNITIDAPTTRWAKPAREKLDTLLKPLSAEKKKRALALSASDYMTRGMAYFSAHRNKESAADFAAALKTGSLDAGQTCIAAFHRAQNWWKERNRTKSAPLFDKAIALCAAAGDAETSVKAKYQAGRSYGRIDDAQSAIARYQAVERDHPKHSYADDARLRQAEEYRELGREEDVTRVLSSLPSRYPRGDMRAEALWRLAWRAYKAGKYIETLSWLDKQIEAAPIETEWWREGQAQYWQARAYGELGQKDKSVASYIAAIRTYPLSYYALLALNRLRETAPKEFANIVAEITTGGKGQTLPPALHFKDRQLYRDPGFLRGVEFLQLGLGRRAGVEFARLGLVSPPGKRAILDPDERERLWAMAFLYDAAGRYDISHWVTRWHLTDYKRRWPLGGDATRWNIAYPKAFWSLLDRYAKKRGYPTELQIAFVREESAFDPARESYANAVGLTQMIFPTAKRFAKGTGIRVSRATLTDPEKNVIIGSRFLSFLFKRYRGQVGLVVPAYNAGEGAVGRWLRLRGTWAQDAFGEEIPQDQARRYSKRVIASFFAYSFLKDQTIPIMPNVIPKEVVRKKR